MLTKDELPICPVATTVQLLSLIHIFRGGIGGKTF